MGHFLTRLGVYTAKGTSKNAPSQPWANQIR